MWLVLGRLALENCEEVVGCPWGAGGKGIPLAMAKVKVRGILSTLLVVMERSREHQGVSRAASARPYE